MVSGDLHIIERNSANDTMGIVTLYRSFRILVFCWDCFLAAFPAMV